MVEKITTKTIEALRQGEHKAFETVFLAYFNKIKFFISGLLKSDADAEELAQDIFVKLWLNHQSIDCEKSFNAYIYTMARNATFNFLKHKGVHDSYVNEVREPEVGVLYSEESVYAKEIALLVELIVDKMPVRRQDIYRMSRIEGLTNEEISERLGISKKTVENQLSLILKELRRVILIFLLIFCIGQPTGIFNPVSGFILPSSDRFKEQNI